MMSVSDLNENKREGNLSWTDIMMPSNHEDLADFGKKRDDKFWQKPIL